MTATMVVLMKIKDSAWVPGYNMAVPSLLAEYGAERLVTSQSCISRLEGSLVTPDRIAVFKFPSMESIDRFMHDPRYLVHRQSRELGATSEIFVFHGEGKASQLI